MGIALEEGAGSENGASALTEYKIYVDLLLKPLSLDVMRQAICKQGSGRRALELCLEQFIQQLRPFVPGCDDRKLSRACLRRAQRIEQQILQLGEQLFSAEFLGSLLTPDDLHGIWHGFVAMRGWRDGRVPQDFPRCLASSSPNTLHLAARYDTLRGWRGVVTLGQRPYLRLGIDSSTKQLINMLHQAEIEIKDKDLEIKDKEKALEIKDKEKEKALLKKDLAQLEKDLHRMTAEKLHGEARYASILCNPFLLEEGLLKLYPKLSLTEGYKKFSPNLLKAQKKGRPTMTPSAKQILQNLTQVSRHAAQQRDVVKDLQDLVHELSKDIHYPELKRTGFLCGGKQPLGAAVAVALCELQAKKALDMNITYVDGKFKEGALLSAGLVLPIV
ncbi:unnamed protein product [Cladocopium goreaui]|uniref:Uncharacterized protein n=1 Tax=Cladocopium goreaui TaxID=2562237 RepID=A0A9P1GP66_9DINO|nr:unnamed protein product [Cladocopium goreaui]